MRVLVTGGSGQFAQAVRRIWTSCDLVIPPEAEFDLADPDGMRRILREVRPEVVLNAGAYTAVDRAETDEARALLINGEAVGVLASACDELGALLVQISTDYVFDGSASIPYLESDPPSPRSAYGRTKLAGEQAAQQAREHLVVRTSWLYDAWGNNFLNTMLRLGGEGRSLRVVDDQRGAPTSCRALANQILHGVDAGWRGLVHATCAGETTWFQFAQAIFQRAGLTVDLSPCTTEAYGAPAPRPPYSVLDGTHRKHLGKDLMPPWEEALDEVLAERLPRGGQP